MYVYSNYSKCLINNLIYCTLYRFRNQIPHETQNTKGITSYLIQHQYVKCKIDNKYSIFR